MKNQSKEIKVALQIRRPANVVFEAIVDPANMANYFISKSSGRMDEGKSLVWRFPEFGVDVPIKVGKIVKDQFISYYWTAEEKELLTEMKLTKVDDNSTLVTITEKSVTNIDGSISWLKGNTEGWANFLACLKAYLEFGINLRKGAFDFLTKVNCE